ncbi:MAG: heme biosynthesis HemY N-terminal domain-containing protein [Pseudomonadota bacterium]|nr:heme biosynthesis HemY N-terminal domain-containing protein [Pseudomonadota bacterium]
MIRYTVYVVLGLGAVVAASIWFSERPGLVSIEWQGWLIELSVGKFVLFVFAVLALLLVAYGTIRSVYRLPRRLRLKRDSMRRERGYQALTRGMVAVAAGDPDEANRQARRADGLLNEPPLTMLLSAQAAQLGGEEAAAARYFNEMLQRPETAFLGLRGLLVQAQKNNDQVAALGYAKQAYELQPKTPWVLATMFKLQAAERRWSQALATLEELVKYTAVPTQEARERRAVVLLGCSQEEEERKNLTQALRFARRASSLAPEFLPAVLRTVELMVALDKPRLASRMIDNAWARIPHPELARFYSEIGKANGPLQRVKRLERLLTFNPDHSESHIALGNAALAADLWGEARNHLEQVVRYKPTAGVYRTLADLEKRSGDDSEAARSWLLLASTAPPDPSWVCDDCAATQTVWSPLCDNCDALGTFSWRSPKLTRRSGDKLDQGSGGK